MPSQFDNTYHNIYRKPTFDDDASKRMWQASREADEVLEVAHAPIPTQEMEREYLDFLQEDFKSDPWVTYRFRKYTANPKRIPWKNTRQLKRQHQFTFCVNWAVGSLLFWPIAAFVGRRMKVTRGGVPVVPLNRWVHDFPHPEPGRTSRITFRYYSFAATILAGYCFARQTTESFLRCSNEWYSRPDLKPFAAMVAKPKDSTTTSMLEAQYVNKRESEGKRSPLYRFFMARDADFTIKENPYAKVHADDIWDNRKGHFATYTNKFGEHHQ